MGKKGIPKVMAKVLMSLFEKATAKIKVESGHSDEPPVRIDVHQGSVLQKAIKKIYFMKFLCRQFGSNE